MKIKSEIEELNAKFEHLQNRFDNLRDYVKEKPEIYAEGYWNKFEDLLAWSMKFEKGSKEYKKCCELGWEMIDRYLSLILDPRKDRK